MAFVAAPLAAGAGRVLPGSGFVAAHAQESVLHGGAPITEDVQALLPPREERGPPRFPKFRRRRRRDSISVVSGVKVRVDRLHVSGFGPLAIHRKGGNPHPDGMPVSAVLKRVGGRWHATVCCAVEVQEPADNGHAIGLDRNGDLVADSDGEIDVMPDMDRLEARSRRLQRKLSRQRKAGRRRERSP